MTLKQSSDEEGFARGFHGIPDDKKIKEMSFTQLASELSSCKSGSPKFMVIEREMKKHLAEDQAKINRPNMLWAAGIGGMFALAGVILGWYLNMAPSAEQIVPTSTMQQVGKLNLIQDSPAGQVEIPAAPKGGSINKPIPIQNNEQPNK